MGVLHREKSVDKFNCEFLVTKLLDPGPHVAFTGDIEGEDSMMAKI